MFLIYVVCGALDNTAEVGKYSTSILLYAKSEIPMIKISSSFHATEESLPGNKRFEWCMYNEKSVHHLR